MPLLPEGSLHARRNPPHSAEPARYRRPEQEAVSDCKVHKLVADVALIADEKVLFVRYADTSRYDGQGGWFLPDDYLDHLEHPDDAARRIMREQAGAEKVDLRLAEVESFANGAWHLVFHYVARLDSSAPVEARGNVAAAEWFPLSSLPPESETAHHGWPLEVLERVLR